MGRRIRRAGYLLLGFFINLLLHMEWGIPAGVLLVLHFWLKISIGWFIGGLVFWGLAILAGMWLMGWAADAASLPDPPRENKNPYSVRKSDGNGPGGA